MTEAQAAATRFAARIIGPLMVIIGAVVILRADALALLLPGLFQDAPLLFITGIFTLIVGLVLFAAHHHWTGVAAIVISLLGVLTILRGVILLVAPDVFAGLATQAVRAPPFAWIAAGIPLLIGVWLSYVGWFAKKV